MQNNIKLIFLILKEVILLIKQLNDEWEKQDDKQT